MSTPGFVVTLDHHMDDESTARTLELLGLIKGVVSVQPVDGDPRAEVMAEQRALSRCRSAMINAAYGLK